MKENIPLLEQLKGLRNLPKEQIVKKYAIGNNHIEKELKYEKLTGLVKMYNPDTFPVHFYFEGENLVMIYSSDSNILQELNTDELIDDLGKGTELKSRVGKLPHYLYAKEGLAFSADNQEIIFLEVFPTCSEEYYLTRIYEEPLTFRK